MNTDLIDLVDRYNRCFYDRDVEALRDLYIADEHGFAYFDNHAGCDASTLDDHLAAVGAFLRDGEVVELDTEVLATSTVGDAGWLVARVRYGRPDVPAVRMSMFAERSGDGWRIRHLHYSDDPSGER